ncbi:hypothetical protein ACPV3A_29530 [Paenibacillus sp. Dod16]
MKREEILDMVPGPALNALVADKVMKWEMKAICKAALLAVLEEGERE